jgi:hypothetical protein
MRLHETRELARRELVAEGYASGFSSPGRPELWIKGKSRKAVAQRIRGADMDWVIVPYPEPSNATPAQVRELAARDGLVLSAGKELQQDPDPVATITDPDADLL